MAPDVSPVNQFFEGAGANMKPALCLIPILLTVIFLPAIDLMIGLRHRTRR